MKKRISDMLDGLNAPDMELNEKTPLSSERIKELTMSKINHTEKNGKRIVFRVLAAAAVIAALTMTAMAAEEIFGTGDWFRDVLNIQLEKDAQHAEEIGVSIRETISEGQIEVVNELGKVFEEQSYTDQGTTMTLTAAYADENVIHLYLKAEAPEGTVLPDDINYTFYDFNNDEDEDGHWYHLKLAEDAPYEISGHFHEIEAMPDDDPTDNKKDFHVRITTQSGMEMKFNDGVSKYLNITGIYEQVPNVDGDIDGYVQIAPGRFTFDIGMVNELEIIQLNVDGLTYGGDVTETWTHDSPCLPLCEENLTGEKDQRTGLPIHSESWAYSVTAKKLTISPLSADWEVEYTSSDGRHSYGLDFKVVMKDGTSPMNLPGGGRTDTDNWCSGTTLFATPIDFDEVDYILIGDEELGETYKVYLPE